MKEEGDWVNGRRKREPWVQRIVNPSVIEQLLCAYEREELQGEKVDPALWVPGCMMHLSRVRNAGRGHVLKAVNRGIMGISDRHVGVQIRNSR